MPVNLGLFIISMVAAVVAGLGLAILIFKWKLKKTAKKIIKEFNDKIIELGQEQAEYLGYTTREKEQPEEIKTLKSEDESQPVQADSEKVEVKKVILDSDSSLIQPSTSNNESVVNN